MFFIKKIKTPRSVIIINIENKKKDGYKVRMEKERKIGLST